jgi:sulfopyruvate decarboxylase
MTSSQAITAILERHRIEKIGYLPCDRLQYLFAQLQRKIPIRHLTRECTGVALAFGWAMGGQRPAMLIQNTGIGNLVTELVTLPMLYGLPLPLVASWRGHYRESIEAQAMLGERMIPMLQGLRIPVTAVETQDDLGALDEGIRECFERSTVRVFLLSPRLWEGEVIGETPEVGSPGMAAVHVSIEGFAGKPGLTRYQAIQTIMENLGEDDVLVTQIGYPSREAHAIQDRARNLYLMGALGSATLVGMGLAEARPDLHVTVLDGDGGFILNPNQMLELSQDCPKNLSVVLLDNGSWGSTGSQPTLTSKGLNLAAFGASVGTPPWRRVTNANEFAEARSRNGQLVHFLIRPGNADVPTITVPAREMARHFQQAIAR